MNFSLVVLTSPRKKTTSMDIAYFTIFLAIRTRQFCENFRDLFLGPGEFTTWPEVKMVGKSRPTQHEKGDEAKGHECFITWKKERQKWDEG